MTTKIKNKHTAHFKSPAESFPCRVFTFRKDGEVHENYSESYCSRLVFVIEFNCCTTPEPRSRCDAAIAATSRTAKCQQDGSLRRSVVRQSCRVSHCGATVNLAPSDAGEASPREGDDSTVEYGDDSQG